MAVDAPDYPTKEHRMVAEVPGLCVRVMALDAGQCVPWHYHSNVTDTFFCMEGPMRVETRAPRGEYVLRPGETCAVPPKTVHYVSGVDHGPCRFMIVQGEGDYDFVAIPAGK